jgi:hypothetical protein
VHLSSDHKDSWGGSERIQGVVLWPVVIGADGGDGLRWSKLMVEVAYGGQS